MCAMSGESSSGLKRELHEEEAHEDAAKRLRGDDSQPAPAHAEASQPPAACPPALVELGTPSRANQG